MNEINVEMINLGEDNRKIAVSVDQGKPEGVFWLGGFMSDMFGSKANALSEWAVQEGQSCIRFDYSAHGLSEGSMEEGTISRWLEEAETVLEQFAKGPQIIIGSSMGGWVALLLAQKVKEKGTLPDFIKALVLIAPAADMTEKLMLANMSESVKAELMEEGLIRKETEYSDEPYIITKKLIEDGRQHLMMEKEIHLGVPIHILQGQRDEDVPFQHALALVEALPHDEVALTLIPDGDHRLSRPEDLEKLVEIINMIHQA